MTLFFFLFVALKNTQYNMFPIFSRVTHKKCPSIVSDKELLLFYASFIR